MASLNLSSWREDSEYFQFGQHKVFVKDSRAKEKPILLLLHGFPTASIDWQLIWPELTQLFRCITLDLIGFGDSSKPSNQPITIIEQANLCRALLADKGVNDAHILSHDYGVSVAQELLAGVAESQAFSPLSCIFLNGGLFPDLHRPRLIQKLLISPLGPLVARLTSYHKFAKNMREVCAQPLHESDLEIYWQLLEQHNGRRVLPALIRYMPERQLHSTRWGNATKTPPCPVLLINGSKDPVSGAHLADAYEQRVDSANVVRLSEIGHYPQVEAPQDVLLHAMKFWKVNVVHNNG